MNKSGKSFPNSFLFSVILLAAAIGSFAAFAEPAEAGFFDRIQDIYEAPDKLEALESKYEEATDELQRQTETFLQEKTELLEKNDAMMMQNEQLAGQNEALAEQNRALLERMQILEERQERRAELTRKLAYGAGAVLGLFLLYVLSVRFWRFLAWRRQRQMGGGA